MANKIRGEVELEAGGKRYRLLLTLGALAEIEDGLGLDDMARLSERLRKMRAADLAIVAAALLRGGGTDLCPADVLRLECDIGTLGAAVAETFARAGGDAAEAEDLSGPFAGTP